MHQVASGVRQRICHPAAMRGIIFVLACCAAAAGCAGSGSAFVINPYVQRPGTTEMTIRWSSFGEGPFTVRYGAGSRLDRELVVSVPHKTVSWEEKAPPAPQPDGGGGAKPAQPAPITRTEYLYAARLTGLAPGTEYRYAVSSGSHKRTGAFKTIPEKTDRVTFIAYGDSRTGIEAHRRVAAGFLKHNPAFIIHTGDLVTAPAHRYWKPEFFDPLAEVIRSVPVFPTIGNHDGDYRRYFSLPNNGLWYSADYGNVHIVSLECRTGKVEEMLAWCDEDLAKSKATWKIVFGHFPTYDVGGHQTRWGRTNFAPIFRKHKVDLVLSGHSHLYERFRPMFTTGENDRNPITYIVTGGGGAPLARLTKDPYLAAGLVDYHFMVFDVEGDKLTGRMILTDGTVFDSFTITKKNGEPDAAYLAQALPEEQFGVLRELVMKYLRGQTLSGPLRPGKPVSLKFKIGADDKAMKYEIRLEPGAAKSYRMEPVRGETAPNETADIDLAISLKKADAYKPGDRLPALLLECIYEIDGKTTSLFFTPREPAPEKPPAPR